MPPQFLLDTNICIYIAKQKPLSVLKKFEQLVVGQVAMSTITYGELQFGAQKSHHPHKTMKVLEELISLIPPLPMPIETGKIYGEIRSKLEKQGMPIGNNDLWMRYCQILCPERILTFKIMQLFPLLLHHL